MTSGPAAPTGAYVADPVAKKHGAAPDETTTSAEEAYARFPPPVFTRYESWLDSR